MLRNLTTHKMVSYLFIYVLQENGVVDRRKETKNDFFLKNNNN